MSKTRRTFLASIGCLLVGVCLFVGALRIAGVQFVQERAVSRLREAILTVDQVEISHLSEPQAHPSAPRYRTKVAPAEYAITATRPLSSEQTKEFLGILSKHYFDARGGAMCHDPGYLLRFTRSGREVLRCSLCLQCMNIEIEPIPFIPIWVTVLDREDKDLSLSKIVSFLAKVDPS